MQPFLSSINMWNNSLCFPPFSSLLFYTRFAFSILVLHLGSPSWFFILVNWSSICVLHLGKLLPQDIWTIMSVEAQHISYYYTFHLCSCKLTSWYLNFRLGFAICRHCLLFPNLFSMIFCMPDIKNNNCLTAVICK